MAQIMYLWGYWGLWKGIAFVGMGLTTAFFFWSLFRAVLSKTPEKALIPFLTALVLVGFISPATKGEGVIPMVQSTGVEWFNALYRTSADVGYAAMSRGENSVQAQTAALGRNLALLVARAQHASTIRAQMAQIKAGKITGDLADPNLANTLYADQIRNEQAGADSLISNRGWIFNVGYWLLFGLFSIFAGIIVVVGGTMQLMLLLLPVALAFLVLGQFKPVTAIGASYLSALLTIGVLPVIVATIASITLGIPAAKMLPVVTQMNGDLSAQLTRYQELLRNGCQWYEVSCNFEAQVFNPILSDLTTIKELFITLVVVVLSGIVGLSIGATFIRRVPAAIAGVFGASGGGESSGVETGGIGKLLAMTGGMKMLQQLTRTPGANASSAGPKTDGSPAPSPGPALPPGGGGGQYTPPESVTAGSGSSTTSTSGNIPPESVTAGNPRTVVGASYAAFQGSRGAGMPFGQAVQAGVQPMLAGAAAGVRAHGQTIRQDYGAAAQRGREHLTRTASNLAFGSANAERGRAAVSAAVQDFRDTNAQVRAQDTTQNRSVNPDEFETRSRRDPVAAAQNAAQAQSHFTVTPEQRAGEQGARPASRTELSARNQGGSLQDWTAAPAPVRPPKLGPPPPRPVSPTEQEAQSHKTRMAQGTGPTLADMDATRRNTLALGGPQGKAIPGVFPGPLEPRPAAPAPTPPLPPPPARRTERAPDEQWQASHRPVADWQPPQKPLPPPPPRVTPPPLDIPLSHLMKPAPTPPDEENPKP
ncbi:TrbL/VirB6 plasmid conjugal transfer protein (plasmid) [Deinococcus gobiensis I-0]|uniref:TrbL/VirB6 plasmid conjugal transfer protein n=2 Tax=Deinococcus TaxID=1298 RepID=H8H1W6_DEIGI|nr:TrbL/VirB6 plasmid conjugal transfer protein [Deinococcus gobiensis I-0]